MEDIIGSLDLVYYQYDNKTKTLFYDDARYSHKIIEPEFFKITYHLCAQNVDYKVLKDKSIRFGFSKLPFREKFKTYLQDMRHKK